MNIIDFKELWRGKIQIWERKVKKTFFKASLYIIYTMCSTLHFMLEAKFGFKNIIQRANVF